MSPTWLALLMLASTPSVAAPPDGGVSATAENRSATKKRTKADKPRNRSTTANRERTARPATTRPPARPTTRPTTAPAPRTPERRTEQVRERVRPVPPPRGTTRPYTPLDTREPVVSRTLARPRPVDVRPHPRAHHPPPPIRTYRPWYTHWYVHPYYRHLHTSVVVVHFDFSVSPYDPRWMPPHRAGWIWVPGYWAYGWWHPGYWRPAHHPAVIMRNVRYVYVPGWWAGPVYVEGWWRAEARPDWVWVPGHYLADGTYVPGHWRPTAAGPVGYVWEPGFFDGDDWIDGFWRPRSVKGFAWVNAWFDRDGVYHAGYWEPIATKAGMVWVPGWFDGTTWIPGYWVEERLYREADPTRYVPESREGPSEPTPLLDEAEAPLALPADA